MNLLKMIFLKEFWEYLGGAKDNPPSGINIQIDSIIWGIWWGILTCGIIFFCGQASKFIYIDF